MAAADDLTRGVLTSVTANTVNSGTVLSITGIEDDDRFGIACMASGAAGSAFLIYSGDYQNANVGNYTLTTSFGTGAGDLYVAEALEGARFRKEDGSIDVEFSVPTGVVWAWKY